MTDRIAPDSRRCEAVNTTKAYGSWPRARPGERCRCYARAAPDARRLCATHAGQGGATGLPRRARALTAPQVREARAVARRWRTILGKEPGEPLGSGVLGYRDDPDAPPTLAALARGWGVALSVVYEAAHGRTYAGVSDA